MHDTTGPSPGTQRNPDHRVDIVPSTSRWQASVGDTVLADTNAGLMLDETGYGSVIYFPPQDVRHKELVATDSATTCPFKGRAAYFAAAGEYSRDVAWTYPSTYDEVKLIEGYLAFYADRVSISEVND